MCKQAFQVLNTAYYLILKHFLPCSARSAKHSIAIVIILSSPILKYTT